MPRTKKDSGSIRPDAPDLPAEFDAWGSRLEARQEPYEGICLERTDLSGARLASVRLRQSRLGHVNLDEAVLTGASLQDVVVSGGSCANVRASESAFRRAEFSQVRLTGADLAESHMEDVQFSDCRADLVSFRFAEIEVVRFENCNLTESDFYGAKLRRVAFVDCDLRGAVLAEATFSECEMRGCDITGVVNPERLRGVAMRWDDIIAAAGDLARAAGVRVIDDTA